MRGVQDSHRLWIFQNSLLRATSSTGPPHLPCPLRPLPSAYPRLPFRILPKTLPRLYSSNEQRQPFPALVDGFV